MYNTATIWIFCSITMDWSLRVYLHYNHNWRSSFDLVFMSTPSHHQNVENEVGYYKYTLFWTCYHWIAWTRNNSWYFSNRKLMNIFLATFHRTANKMYCCLYVSKIRNHIQFCGQRENGNRNRKRENQKQTELWNRDIGSTWVWMRRLIFSL